MIKNYRRPSILIQDYERSKESAQILSKDKDFTVIVEENLPVEISFGE